MGFSVADPVYPRGISFHSPSITAVPPIEVMAKGAWTVETASRRGPQRLHFPSFLLQMHWVHLL